MNWHFVRLRKTVRMLFILGMARTFGRYRHNVWNGEFDYAVYTWRGKDWAFPLASIGEVP